MNRYIIERPAGMPDWVEIGIKVMVRDNAHGPWEGPVILQGWMDGDDLKFMESRGSWYRYAKPFIPWTPKEGEWCAFWDEKDDYATFRKVYINEKPGIYSQSLQCRYLVWDYVARITNDDGTLIDIRCTVDELKAKTDWLGPEEN
jgi:hypothetical protein